MSVRATAVHRNRSAICTAVPPPIAPPPLSGPGGFDKEDALVLAADAAAALIGHGREGRGELGGDNDDGRRQWR